MGGLTNAAFRLTGRGCGFISFDGPVNCVLIARTTRLSGEANEILNYSQGSTGLPRLLLLVPDNLF